MATKNQRLLNRPVEKDTHIIMEHLVEFGEIPALMELWRWDGITASSVIFLYEDVGHMKQEELVKFTFEKMNIPVDPQYTFTVKMDYVYINFGFKVD